MSKIMIVDDHPIVRMAVRILLERAGHTIEAEADNGVDAVYQAQKIQPDILILDIGIPKLDGFEVISRIVRSGVAMKILVLSSQPSSYAVSRCMQAGASGYVSKEKDLSEVVDAVNALLKNNNYFPQHIAGIMAGTPDTKDEVVNFSKLSNRELMVLQQLVIGKSNKDIADDMLLSAKTISTYKVRLLGKLNASSLADLIEIAKRNSLT